MAHMMTLKWYKYKKFSSEILSQNYRFMNLKEEFDALIHYSYVIISSDTLFVCDNIFYKCAKYF